MLAAETIRAANGRSWRVFMGGNGPRLVWLHGMRGVAPEDPVLARLAERFAVVAPLAPGFADAGELTGLDDVRDLALAYDDLLAALGGEPPLLVGHSFGAMIAAEVAALVPTRVRRLVLLAPLGLWNDAHPVADFFAVPASELDTLLWQDPTARDAFNGLARRSDVEAALFQALSLSTVARFLWPIPDKGLRRRLYRIAVPTRVILAGADAILPPAYADDFRSGIAGAETSVLEGTGHMAPYEQPARVSDLITEFAR